MADYQNPLQNMRHDRMTAWACANAILVYCGQPQALYGEWRDATNPEHLTIDPVEMAKRIMKWRSEAAEAA